MEINDVSDTSLWVAHYRAKETERPDALFRDPFAKALVGERGRQIAESMAVVGKYTEWSVVSRTVIIDEFIQKLVSEGVDTIINLGAGMDARPYRMNLPTQLRWIEVDFPNIIAHKSKILADETPKCQLARFEVDLTNDESSTNFFKGIVESGQKIAVLTEGVVPYLKPAQVAKLASILNLHSQIQFWIAEYFNPGIYPYLKRGVRSMKMKNAPFQFYPPDWFGFFAEHGWIKREVGYGADIAIRFKRKPPMPWIARLLVPFMSQEKREQYRQASGYVIFEKKK